MSTRSFGSEFWNARFAADEYLFGTRPARFVEAHADQLAPGSRVLVPADGEGRNSVFLAGEGHQVVATDIAERGVAKARRLAATRAVEVDVRQLDIHSWDWPATAFDAIVAVFIQFSPPAERERVFAGLARSLVPGGLLMLHGYTPKQLEYGTGGPPCAEFLYTEALLREAFGDWELLRLESYERELDEGSGHKGRSALIDLIARRPAP